MHEIKLQIKAYQQARLEEFNALLANGTWSLGNHS